jgi:hypothetical protein
MEQNRKLTEVPLAEAYDAASGQLLGVMGGSLKRIPGSLLPGAAETGGGTPYVEALAPDEGESTAYRVSDTRLTPKEGEAFFCLFPDDDAPTRDHVSLNVNGVDCQLYWKGEQIGLMARTLGHVFTRSNGYVHLVCTAPGQLELAGVDSINHNGRLYLTPSQYLSNEWYAAD